MGWAEGLQSGMALGNLINQGFDRRELADEAKKHQVTEGAYGPDLQQNIDQVRALQAQNPDQAAQYEPALAELTRRQGLTAPDYSYGGQTFGTRQEAEAAASQGRTQGLANVYRAQGNVEKASELEARAQQQQLTGLQLKKATRADEADVRMGNFNNDLNSLENPTTEQIKELAQKHKLDRGQQFEVASQITGIAKNQLEAHDIEIKQATKGKTFEQLLDLHKNDKRFNDGFHFVQSKGPKGEIVLNMVSDADPSKVLRSQSFKDADMATAYLRREAEDPGNVAEWMLGMQAKQSQIDVNRAHIGALGTSSALHGLQIKTIQDTQAGRAEAAKLAGEFADLTVAEQNGPKGLALMKQINMANLKAGGQLSLAGAGSAGKQEKTMTDAEKLKFETLLKTDAWEQAERKGDTAALNKLLVGRGLSPSLIGQQGVAGWGESGGGTTTPAAQTGIQTTTPAAPSLTSTNTRLLGRAGNTGYNVELPDGSTRVMGVDELERLGYRFPSGSGLQRSWYSDLMPR